MINIAYYDHVNLMIRMRPDACCVPFEFHPLDIDDGLDVLDPIVPMRMTCKQCKRTTCDSDWPSFSMTRCVSTDHLGHDSHRQGAPSSSDRTSRSICGQLHETHPHSLAGVGSMVC